MDFGDSNLKLEDWRANVWEDGNSRWDENFTFSSGL